MKQVIIMLLVVAMTLLGCGDINKASESQGITSVKTPENTLENASQSSQDHIENGTTPDVVLKISATLFPQYSFAKAIGGDRVSVEMVVPVGVEVHSFEPTPRTIADLRSSDLLLFTGEMMEPWLHDMLSELEDAPVVIVDLSDRVSLLKSEDEHGEEETALEEDDHDHGVYDPHYWLDPSNAIIMVEEITEAMIALEPTLKDEFEGNAGQLIQEIQVLDEAFYAYFDSLDHPKIVYGGHFAFGYFTQRYGIDYISPFSSFSPDAEPTPKQIAEIIDYIESSHVKTIFYEELVSSKLAESISDETGAQMLLLSGVHNVTKAQIESGETYVTLMYQNLENLKKGLE